MHFLKPTLSLEFELRNNRDIEKEEGWINYILFGGPAFHTCVGKFFANITTLSQVINLHKSA